MILDDIRTGGEAAILTFTDRCSVPKKVKRSKKLGRLMLKSGKVYVKS
jgi:hypothetical protein